MINYMNKESETCFVKKKVIPSLFVVRRTLLLLNMFSIGFHSDCIRKLYPIR